MEQLYIGTAGWQLPKDLSVRTDGTTLERYAELFPAVEINSTHYKHHMERTYRRWAASVPTHFRFAVKMHRDVTHVQRLTEIGPVQQFLNQVGALGDRLGPVLIQLPPSLVYSERCCDVLGAMREIYAGAVVLEPRHPTWGEPNVLRALRHLSISVVAADPPMITSSIVPLGDRSLCYFRLHGQPRIYWSPYEEDTLLHLAEQVVGLLQDGSMVWVMFDNTASGEAAPNALRLLRLIGERRYKVVPVPHGKRKAG